MIISGTHNEARLDAINIISNNEDVKSVSIFPTQWGWCVDYDIFSEDEFEDLIEKGVY